MTLQIKTGGIPGLGKGPERYRLLIDGNWIAANDGQNLERSSSGLGREPGVRSVKDYIEDKDNTVSSRPAKPKGGRMSWEARDGIVCRGSMVHNNGRK